MNSQQVLFEIFAEIINANATDAGGTYILKECLWALIGDFLSPSCFIISFICLYLVQNNRHPLQKGYITSGNWPSSEDKRYFKIKSCDISVLSSVSIAHPVSEWCSSGFSDPSQLPKKWWLPAIVKQFSLISLFIVHFRHLYWWLKGRLVRASSKHYTTCTSRCLLITWTDETAIIRYHPTDHYEDMEVMPVMEDNLESLSHEDWLPIKLPLCTWFILQSDAVMAIVCHGPQNKAHWEPTHLFSCHCNWVVGCEGSARMMWPPS